ncbi:MAG: response regulator transcription factor [Chloroflexi bacterium]|nr:response regulator transcription factor [Chloroflexota bacterium]
MLGQRVITLETAPILSRPHQAFTAAGYLTYAAESAGKIEQLTTMFDPDLVIIATDCEGATAIASIQAIRRSSNVPIIAITAFHTEHDIINILAAGADLYLDSSVSSNLLVAQARALLRRRSDPDAVVSGYHDSLIDLDVARHYVAIRGERLKLSPTEFRLLVILAMNEGKAVSHQELIDAIWGSPYPPKGGLRWHVSALRKKLEPDLHNPQVIVTVRGAGYAYIAPSTAGHAAREAQKRAISP